MKRTNKRTLAVKVLAAGVLTATVFLDDSTFAVKRISKEKTANHAESKSKEESSGLLFTDENGKEVKVWAAGLNKYNFSSNEKKVKSVLENTVGIATMEAKDVPMVTSAQVLPWEGIAMANVDVQADVYAEASEAAVVVGRIRRGDEAEVLEYGAQWTKLKSGNVSGYVKSEYLVFGTEAEQFATLLGKKVVTVQADGVFVRTLPSVEAQVSGQVDKGEQYTYISQENGWIAIKDSEGKNGYISEQYAAAEWKSTYAITLEEEIQLAKELEEAAKRAAEQKEAEEREAAKKKAQKQAKAEQEAQARAQAEEQEAAKSSEEAKQVSASVDDVTLLAAIIEIEAGTNYEGGVAVGNVILNRVNSSSFPNSISGVIYQRGQFPGAHNGKLARVLSRGPASTCYRAAEAALNGENIVGGKLFFNSTRTAKRKGIKNYIEVGGNCFF